MNVAELKERMRGQLIGAEDPDYDQARAVYNAAIDGRPRLLARCRDAADVVAAVTYAREQGLLLAVRGGRHSGAGLGVCEDGLVVDLSPMRGVRVDPSRRTVRVEGGAVWSDVDHATHAFGLAVPCGIVASTGVGGLSLGGGHGYLTRKYGLTIDNLLEADVVLADGRLVTASPEQNADLFWALRGGGGNFGVVTSFLFRGQPVAEVHAGPTFWAVEDTAEVMAWYRDFMAGAPDDLYGFFLETKVPPAPIFPAELHGRTVCGVLWCHLGGAGEAEELVQTVRAFKEPLLAHVGAVPLPALNALFDPLMPPGLQWYWKGHFVNELPDDAIALHAEFGAAIPSDLSTMHLYPIDGAAGRVPRDATAFSYRDARWSMVIAGIDPHRESLPRISAWAKDYWRALKPFSSGSAYVNFMQEEEPDRVRSTYRDNYPRLTKIKKRYDPENLFRVNWNIPPG